MRRLLAPLALILTLLPAGAAAARTSVVEVTRSGPLTEQSLERLGLDVTHKEDADSIEVLLHDDADRRRLAESGLSARTVLSDLEAATAKWRAQDEAAAARGAEVGLPSGRAPMYRSLEEFDTELGALVRPGLARRFELPKRSLQGRPIWGIEIATGVERVDDGRPAYVIGSLHHAREWPSGEIAMEFAHDLVKRFEAGDERVKSLLDRVRIFIVPVSNPDGFLQSKTVDVLHRRNCRAVGAETQQPGVCGSGVDPNRNYGALWGGPGASTSTGSDSYRGPGPFSEPETQAYHEFSQRLHITNFQSLHNIAGQVLRQPGNFDYGEISPDEGRMKALGDPMAAQVGYDSLLGWELYPVHGATEDWNYVAQGALGYTIEIGPKGSPPGSFQGPYQTHVVDQYLGGPSGGATLTGLRESLLLAAEQAANPADHSVLAGTAPAGRVLRLRKTFQTSTSRRCVSDVSNDGGKTCPGSLAPMLFDDFIETTLTVPASGRFEWHVNPSTRPYAPPRSEAWTLTCEEPTGRVLQTQSVVVGRGERIEGPLACGAAGGGTGGGTGGGGGTDEGNTLTPAFRLSAVGGRQRLRTILRRGVAVSVTCNAPCRAQAAVYRRGSSPRRLGRRLGRKTSVLSSAGTQRVRVKLSRAAKRSLRRRAPARLALRVTARKSGSSASRTRRTSVRIVR